MTFEKEKTAVVQTSCVKNEGLTLKYELRFEQGVYSLLCVLFDGTGCLDFDYVYDVAPRGDVASDLMRALSEGFVTPVSLREVLEELLG